MVSHDHFFRKNLWNLNIFQNIFLLNLPMLYDTIWMQNNVTTEIIWLILFLNRYGTKMKAVPQSYYYGRLHTHSNDSAIAQGISSVGGNGQGWSHMLLLSHFVLKNSHPFIAGKLFLLKWYFSRLNRPLHL